MSNRSVLVESSVVYDGKRVRLRRDRLVDGEGREFTREVVEHPGSAVVVPFLDDERLVLLHHWRHAMGEELVELPAGTLEPGEDPAACAARELEEETGYRAGKLVPLGVVYPSPGILTERMHLFVASDLEPGSPDKEPGEQITVVLMGVDEALAGVRSGEIRDGKTVLGILRATGSGT